MTPQPQEAPVTDYFKSVGKAALTSAVVYGLSAASPPLGAVLLPAYTAYSYSKLGYGLLKVYEEISAEKEVRSDSLGLTSGSIGDIGTQMSADSVASALVTRARDAGLFREMATKTGVQEVVFSEMLKGSTSSALSTGGSELTKFAIMKAVGA